MKAVNLYLLTRQVAPDILSEFEYALSGRDKSIKCRPEEIDMISSIVDQFFLCGAAPHAYDGWFYAFTIPQIGKEFDLLRISEDRVINIELKSQPVELRRVEKQLYQNRYYLGHLNKKIYSFTLIRDYGSMRVLTYENGLRYSSFEEIISRIGENYRESGIEELFDPCFYLVSPINTPDRFLEKEYFLNNQQTSIRKSIMEADPERRLFGIRGSAGTGKTLLLYDIAFAYGETRPTCIVHSGILSEGHQYLKEHADRVDLLPAKTVDRQTLEKYEVICVDETQRLYASVLDAILEVAEQGAKRCVFAYDFSQALSKSEIRRNNPERLNRIEGFEEFRLKDRVRTNNEINSFIRNMLRLYDRPKRKMLYEDVDVLCANDTHEADLILRLYMSRGYQLITLFPANVNEDGSAVTPGEFDATNYEDATSSREVIGQEDDKV
ncbi:MAG: AAA family ATPase, partial [Lachnospiraceae bacterium]|nr:AAA family ATPase [Lachnospiraceae bacterium]